MSLVTSLVMNEWNILVEGAADKPIVEGIFHRHYKEERDRVLVNGSLAESKDAFLARFYDRTGLPYVILLDHDSGGRDLLAEFTRIGIPREKIIKLDEVFPGRSKRFCNGGYRQRGLWSQSSGNSLSRKSSGEVGCRSQEANESLRRGFSHRTRHWLQQNAGLRRASRNCLRRLQKMTRPATTSVF